MTGAELLVRCLEREGVEYVFGVSGEERLGKLAAGDSFWVSYPR